MREISDAGEALGIEARIEVFDCAFAKARERFAQDDTIDFRLRKVIREKRWS
jgi:hypothetical protein